MVEHYDTDDDHPERPSFREASADVAMTLSRRFNSLQSASTNAIAATPRIGAAVEVCGTLLYKKFNDDMDMSGNDAGDTGELRNASKTIQEKRKLIIIMVGLPGRGKTYLCNKLMCYLNWLGHVARHFNVGSYRRKIRSDGDGIDQDAAFFDHTNQAGMRARQQALEMALEALTDWLSERNENQVAIFDATNTTEERRQFLIDRFHGKFQYLFIESICNDEETLRRNCELKLKYSPDYTDMQADQAMTDFCARIKQYEKVYEPLSNRAIHFIQLNNMVTGRGYMDVNRISGYIPGKIVFFLMQICRSGLSSNRRIWLTRHGESEYNRQGLIGGDAPLTDRGRKYASALARALCTLVPVPENDETLLPVSCWTSTLVRTIQTARHIPFPKLRWKALDEIHAGICDGHTYEQIKDKWPETYAARKRDKLNFRYPAGESYMDVVKRLESAMIEVERESESVCIVGHQAILRVLYSYFMQVNRAEMPELQMPLHTLIELEPRPDGTMVERRFKINIDSTSDDDLFESIEEFTSPQSPGSKAACPSRLHPTRAAHEYFGRDAEAAGPGGADALQSAVETAEAQATQQMRADGTGELKRVAFAQGSLKGSLRGEESSGTLSASLRQASIASCASEWVEGLRKIDEHDKH